MSKMNNAARWRTTPRRVCFVAVDKICSQCYKRNILTVTYRGSVRRLTPASLPYPDLPVAARQGTVVDACQHFKVCGPSSTRSHANHWEEKTFDNAVEKTNNTKIVPWIWGKSHLSIHTLFLGFRQIVKKVRRNEQWPSINLRFQIQIVVNGLLLVASNTNNFNFKVQFYFKFEYSVLSFQTWIFRVRLLFKHFWNI